MVSIQRFFVVWNSRPIFAHQISSFDWSSLLFLFIFTFCKIEKVFLSSLKSLQNPTVVEFLVEKEET